MAGTWSETNKQIIPGFYNRFKWMAENRLTQGTKGVVAMPVKSDWGPMGKVTSVSTEPELKKTFGSNGTLSAYKLGKLVLLGQPSELLLYRMGDGEEKVASITLKDTSGTPTDAIKLETLYPTTRNFNVSVKPDIADETLTDVTLYEGTGQLYTFKVSGSTSEIVEQINGDSENIWLKATKVADGNDTLASIVNQPLTDGNDGTENITNENYVDAMAAFEQYKINVFTLDGIADTALQTTVQTWIDRNKSVGYDVIGCFGSSSSTSIDAANTQSKAFNNECVVNVGNGGIYEGVTYTPAESACYVAGIIAAATMKESICNKETIFKDVSPKLTREQIEQCLKSGTLIFAGDGIATNAIVVDDVNTLKSYGEDQSESLGYIRAVRFMHAVNADTTITKRDYIGKIPNGDLGQKVVLSALKQYFETLQSDGVIGDFTVEVDADLQANAKDDEFYWKWAADYINVMKKIYGTGYIS